METHQRMVEIIRRQLKHSPQTSTIQSTTTVQPKYKLLTLFCIRDLSSIENLQVIRIVSTQISDKIVHEKGNIVYLYITEKRDKSSLVTYFTSTVH